MRRRRRWDTLVRAELAMVTGGRFADEGRLVPIAAPVPARSQPLARGFAGKAVPACDAGAHGVRRSQSSQG